MPPAQDDLTIVRGDTFQQVRTISDLSTLADGLATLTADQVSAVLERRHGGPVADRVAFTVTVDEGQDANSHVVTLSLTDEQTAALPHKRMEWSLRVTDTPDDADDVTHTLLHGNVTVVTTTHAQGG